LAPAAGLRSGGSADGLADDYWAGSCGTDCRSRWSA
jgi:hypothetical protein